MSSAPNENFIKIYCEGTHCEGEPVVGDIEIIEDGKCLICYEDLNGKVGIMEPCRHFFCSECVRTWRESKLTEAGCSFCRTPVQKIIYTDKHIAEFSKITDNFTKRHAACQVSSEFKECIRGLNEEWQELVNFIIKSQATCDYKGFKGIEYLNLEEYEPEDKGKAIVCLKKAGEIDQVVVSCVLANLSIRIRITETDDFGFDVENEYADHVVKSLNSQLKVCWVILSQIINRNHMDKIYIRKFEKYTAALLLCGFNDLRWKNSHLAPMRETLRKINRTNFDESHFDDARKRFPYLDLSVNMPCYNIGNYCCAQHIENTTKERELLRIPGFHVPNEEEFSDQEYYDIYLGSDVSDIEFTDEE